MLELDIRKALPDFQLEVNLSLGNGIMAVFGPSGSGKTTLLQSIAGIQRPDCGSIVLNGRVFFSAENGIDLPARVRNIGYVFQDYALFPHMTVKQNALYGVKGCKGKDKSYRLSVIEVLDMLKITHLQDRYPDHLSGGEKQRVALARALMVEPELLLLDEPLSALDDRTRAQLRRELKELQRQWNIPFIVVTHSRADLSALADWTMFLTNGRQCQEVNNGFPINGFKRG